MISNEFKKEISYKSLRNRYPFSDFKTCFWTHSGTLGDRSILILHRHSFPYIILITKISLISISSMFQRRLKISGFKEGLNKIAIGHIYIRSIIYACKWKKKEQSFMAETLLQYPREMQSEYRVKSLQTASIRTLQKIIIKICRGLSLY